MAHNSSTIDAIQIIRSRKKEDANSKNTPEVIELVKQYRNGPSLEDVLCKENKDLPLLIISICGKTRTGKSFLLNTMIKYLESNGSEEWKNGLFPRAFDWEGGIDSVTKGLWICPKVFKRRNQQGKQVGILLLDNQGLFDGEQSEGMSVAISGISTTMCNYQIFNVKEKICENDLESMWRHLMPDGNDLSDASSTKLVFAVRDFLDEKNGVGLDYGKAYIEADQTRGSEAHKDLWRELRKTFPETICLLLPHPGDQVRRGNVENMRDIEPRFLKEVELFFSKMFDPKKLNDVKNMTTGQDTYDILRKYDGKEADESLSFANIFTEQGNENKLEILKRNLERRLDSFDHDPSNGQSLIKEFLTEAKNRFKGKSSDQYCDKLKKFMEEKINLEVKRLILGRYEYALKNSSNVGYTHTLDWDFVKKRLTYLVGSEAEQNQIKEKVIVGCADLYYRILREELVPKFETLCENKTLVDLRGYDEAFVSSEFRENDDFLEYTTTRIACKAVWLKEKGNLHCHVQDRMLTYVAALAEFDKEWLQNATKTQFKFFEIFTWSNSHWIQVCKNDVKLLEVVGYTMFKTVKKLSDYSKDEMKAIKKIAEQIKSQSPSSPVKLSCIFILYHHKGNESCEPVFKVWKESECTFIDCKGRAYLNWEAFEKDNKLPDCLYCHPCEGEYSKKQGFRVAFTFSPACSFGNKVLRVLDVGSKVVALGAAGALGTVVALPAATAVAIGGAVAAGVAGSYGLIRNIVNIADKVSHDESMEALDALEVVANCLSVAASGVTAGAVLLTTIGRELASAPAIIQGISLLTNLVFQLDSENISYLSVANDISMFLLFNSKSLDGAIDNIRQSLSLPQNSSNLDTLKGFISKNSVTFPKADGEILTTEQFFSENLKSLMLTAIMNKVEQRPLKFIRETVAAHEDLSPLQNLFGNVSQIDGQVRFFEELITSIVKIIQKKRVTNYRGVSYQGIGYHPTKAVTNEVSLAGVCTGLTSIAECSGDECIQQVCSITKEVLKLVCKNAETVDIEGITAYLESNGNEVVQKVVEMF